MRVWAIGGLQRSKGMSGSMPIDMPLVQNSCSLQQMKQLDNHQNSNLGPRDGSRRCRLSLRVPYLRVWRRRICGRVRASRCTGGIFPRACAVGRDGCVPQRGVSSHVSEARREPARRHWGTIRTRQDQRVRASNLKIEVLSIFAPSRATCALAPQSPLDPLFLDL